MKANCKVETDNSQFILYKCSYTLITLHYIIDELSNAVAVENSNKLLNATFTFFPFFLYQVILNSRRTQRKRVKSYW